MKEKIILEIMAISLIFIDIKIFIGFTVGLIIGYTINKFIKKWRKEK